MDILQEDHSHYFPIFICEKMRYGSKIIFSDFEADLIIKNDENNYEKQGEPRTNNTILFNFSCQEKKKLMR